MARVVAAVAASHAPGITGFPERAGEGQAAAVHAAFSAAGELLARTRPQAVLGVSVEHFTNFFVNNLPTFALCTAGEFRGPPNEAFAGFIRVAQRRYAGESALGEHLFHRAVAAEFDLSLVEGDFVFDENFCVPLSLLSPQPPPLVPLIVNGVNPPFPTLRRCYRLGQALRAALEEYGGLERVAVLATGGLSHWVGMPQSGQINAGFDQLVREAFSAGDVDRLLTLTDADLDEAGNGAHEIRSWLVAWGVIGGRPLDVLAYEAVPAWLTGTCVAAADLDTDERRRS